MSDSTQKADYIAFAERLVKSLPKAVRDQTVVEQGGGKYALVKHDGRTVASVRSRNVKIVHSIDGSAGMADALAPIVASAALSRVAAAEKAEKAKAAEKPKAEKKPAKAEGEAEDTK